MNILIVGVGGQGTVLTSKVLGKYAELSGFDCKLSEVHGMSQRGGSVVTHVRMDKVVHSPVIWEGGADIILAFEKLEAFRAKHYLKSDGIILVNDIEILPMPCITGAVKYPENIRQQMLTEINHAYFIPASNIAEKAGSVKAVNIVMLGAMCRLFEFDYDRMKQAVSDCVPPKFRDLNLKALQLGYDKVK